MPFKSKAYNFDEESLKSVYEIGATYGLFRPNLYRPGFFTCLYVGQTNNLRVRLCEHLNNPPVAGATHFFGEAISTDLGRRARERQLIAEFNPIGNKTRGG